MNDNKSLSDNTEIDLNEPILIHLYSFLYEFANFSYLKKLFHRV